MDSTTTQTGNAGLRERKKVATRQALALAAMKLAVQRGLENIRVEDITDAVNVSRRTFTNYFASKEEAIASLSADRFARAAQALRDRPTSEPVSASLAEVFAAQHEAADRLGGERLAPVQMLMTSPALQGEALKTMVAAEEPLVTAIAERTGTDPEGDLYRRVLAAAVMAAVRTATAQWGISDGSLSDLIRQAVRQVTEQPAADATPAPDDGPESNRPEDNQPEDNQPR